MQSLQLIGISNVAAWETLHHCNTNIANQPAAVRDIAFFFFFQKENTQVIIMTQKDRAWKSKLQREGQEAMDLFLKENRHESLATSRIQQNSIRNTNDTCHS